LQGWMEDCSLLGSWGRTGAVWYSIGGVMFRLITHRLLLLISYFLFLILLAPPRILGPRVFRRWLFYHTLTHSLARSKQSILLNEPNYAAYMHACMYVHTHVFEPRVNKLLWEKKQAKTLRDNNNNNKLGIQIQDQIKLLDFY